MDKEGGGVDSTDAVERRRMSELCGRAECPNFGPRATNGGCESHASSRVRVRTPADDDASDRCHHHRRACDESHRETMSWGAPVSAPTNPNNDFQVANPPSDGISSLEWSPMGNFLVATAWDGDVRVCVMRRVMCACGLGW